ncbi:hypothetical protein EDD15DRAFT_2369324 [Pisolithus albus]|nr:hypothetical protein EDD15DRAFT_2369324 [Pisolithus albus]
MAGRASSAKGTPSVSSASEHSKLRATWTEPDVLSLLDYVEDNRFKAGDRMVFPEGFFNDLLPRLPIQPNGHRKTAKNCHDKWESLKREYYAASAIAGGSGLAYSAEKGANVVTAAGQLVMEDLIETRPEAAQFQRKGFKFWDRMQQFVPPDKARGTTAHHAGTFTKASASASSGNPMPSQPTLVPPVQHHSSHQPPAQSHTQYQPPPTQSSVQYSFVQYQIEAPDQSTQNVQCGRAASSQTPFVMPNLPQASSAMPSVPLNFPTHPDPTISPSSIPVSPPSSAMTHVSHNIWVARAPKCHHLCTARGGPV